jgi:hypothetical protein
MLFENKKAPLWISGAWKIVLKTITGACRAACNPLKKAAQ